MTKIEFAPGLTIEKAMELLKKEAANRKDICCGSFNDHILFSYESIDDAYKKILGKTKAQFDEERQKELDEYNKRENEFKAKIPILVEDYQKRARGLVNEDTLQEWDRIVPVRVRDIYHGMECEQTLQVCAIMLDESQDYDARLRKAYKLFMESGHSGMSASLTAAMIRKFCPYGRDVADAVLNFRFEEK